MCVHAHTCEQHTQHTDCSPTERICTRCVCICVVGKDSTQNTSTNKSTKLLTNMVMLRRKRTIFFIYYTLIYCVCGGGGVHVHAPAHEEIRGQHFILLQVCTCVCVVDMPCHNIDLEVRGPVAGPSALLPQYGPGDGTRSSGLAAPSPTMLFSWPKRD